MISEDDVDVGPPDLRALAEEAGFSWPESTNDRVYSGQFWYAATGSENPPWWGGGSGVWRLPIEFLGLLDVYLEGRTAPVFVVFAQMVLAARGSCPPVLTAEASRLLASEVCPVGSGELQARITHRVR